LVEDLLGLSRCSQFSAVDRAWTLGRQHCSADRHERQVSGSSIAIGWAETGHMRRTGAVLVLVLLNDTQEYPQHHAQYHSVALHEIAPPFGTDSTHWRPGRRGKT